MTWKFLRYPISFLAMSIMVSGCFQSDYTKLVKSELAKGVRVDSVVFGINLGDTRDEYFGKCYDLNQEKLVTEGPFGGSVQYLFKDSLFHDQVTPMRMLFIPVFDNKEFIIEINLEFSYPSWAPWNEQYQSAMLKEKVLKMIMHGYKGNDFVKATINGNEYPIKLDGNRRMIVYIKDEQNVVVKIQDILHPKYRHSITSDVVPKE